MGASGYGHTPSHGDSGNAPLGRCLTCVAADGRAGPTGCWLASASRWPPASWLDNDRPQLNLGVRAHPTWIMRAGLQGLVVIALAAPGSSSASAQAPPAWGLSLAAGAGPHNEQAGDVYYRTKSAPSARVAVSYRVGSGAVRPVVQTEFQPSGPGGQLADCPFAPNGTCREYFPRQQGAGLAFGVTLAPLPTLQMTALGGGGRYGAHPNIRARRFVELEVGYAVRRSLVLTAALRQMTWREPERGPHWYRPVYMGLRFQW